MAGNFRAAASERNPDLSTVRAIEKAIWLKKAHYPWDQDSCGSQWHERDARVPYSYAATSHSVLNLPKSDFFSTTIFTKI